jgi:hypothetical protein
MRPWTSRSVVLGSVGLGFVLFGAAVYLLRHILFHGILHSVSRGRFHFSTTCAPPRPNSPNSPNSQPGADFPTILPRTKPTRQIFPDALFRTFPRPNHRSRLSNAALIRSYGCACALALLLAIPTHSNLTASSVLFNASTEFISSRAQIIFTTDLASTPPPPPTLCTKHSLSIYLSTYLPIYR